MEPCIASEQRLNDMRLDPVALDIVAGTGVDDVHALFCGVANERRHIGEIGLDIASHGNLGSRHLYVRPRRRR